MRVAPEHPYPTMRNRHKSTPFYLRRWFVGTLIALLVFCCVASVALYVIHLQMLDKANSFDMTLLGKMESASTIFDRRNETFGYIYEQKREPIPLSQVSEDLRHAVLATEDSRFYSHSGSDYIGIARAAVKNLRSSKIRQGASTITQQLARNTFPLKGRTFSRKILEIYVSRRIETTLTKDQILEYYLNRIYLGSGLYGVEAASKGYFGKSAKDLTLSEAATLAGLIKSPNNYSPWRDKATAQSWRDVTLGRMLDEQYISREQFQTTVAEPLVVKPRILASSDSYALEAIRQQVIAQVGLDRATGEGLHIFTTIDARLQKASEDALRRQLDETERRPSFQNHQTYAQYAAAYREEEKKAAILAAQDPKAPPANIHAAMGAPEYLQGSLLVMNNTDGAVLALVGGRDFKHSEFNRATHAQARRPAGTAFMPFVYAAAYQKGISPGRLFLDQVIDNRQVMVGGQTGILGEWGVERVNNRYEGLMPANLALIRGKNAATVRIGNEVGLSDVLALAKRGGIASPLREFPATFLGSSEVTLAELATAYSSFPNGGWHPASPYLLTRIEDADGEVLFQAKPRTRVRMIDEIPAYQVHSALAESLKTGTASWATTRFGLKTMSAGGKPGTSYNFTDALFAGYNSQVTCAVWMGFDKPTPIYRGAFGGELTLPVWVEVMNASTGILTPREIPMPRGLRKVEICTKSGDLATERCYETVEGERRRTTFSTYVTAAEAPQQPCAVHGGGRSLATLALATKLASGSQQVLQQNGQPVPKAVAVVNTVPVKPVLIKTPSVIGADKDPYGAVMPATATTVGSNPPTGGGEADQGVNKSPETVSQSGNASAQPLEREVRRATAVAPVVQEEAPPVSVKVDPPEALEFN
jgi:membrane carboxypeptidase/penicillin-binding protein